MSEHPLIPADPDTGNMQMIPAGYVPARDTPEQNRDDRDAVIMSRLMADMDSLTGGFARVNRTTPGDLELLAAFGVDIVMKWHEIRKAMKA